MTVDIYKQKIGALIQDTRQAKGMTQAQLAALIGTSQSAINRIEKGGQNISLEMVARISDVLSTNILTLGNSNKINFRVNGGRKLSGSIEVKTSKNAAVGLLCASLLNKGKTTLRHVARIEEVNRILQEVTIYADKICVDEELVRLRSHIQATRLILEEKSTDGKPLQMDEGVGRKLDFLAQEMNRESNTILSKTDDLEVSNRGIELKTTIEKVREQIQNIE